MPPDDARLEDARGRLAKAELDLRAADPELGAPGRSVGARELLGAASLRQFGGRRHVPLGGAASWRTARTDAVVSDVDVAPTWGSREKGEVGNPHRRTHSRPQALLRRVGPTATRLPAAPRPRYC